MADADIILNIDPPVWNAVKFLILAVAITPLLELLFHRVIDSKATYDVLNGEHLSLWESRLAIFSLHSSYWGPRRNKALLLFVALPILAADLLVEYSFSATTIDVAEQVQVWLQPPHTTRYSNASIVNVVYFTEDADPSQFLSQIGNTCTEGPSSVSRSPTNYTSGTTDEYISGSEYRMNGTYVIRNSYLTSDNQTTVCSFSKTVGHLSFVFPHVVHVRGATRGEGVNPNANDTGFDQMRAVMSKQPFQFLGTVPLEAGLLEIYASDNVTCGTPRDFGVLCCAMVGDTFVLANTSSFTRGGILGHFYTPIPGASIAVILSVSGAPISGLKSPERRIRLLASIVGARLVSSYRFGDRPSQRLITKNTLELIAFMAMNVANEEGVGGIQDEKGLRSIKTGEKQSATMRPMAFIPIGILLFSVVALVTADFVYYLLITRKLTSDGVKRLSTRHALARTRVKMTMQWFFEKVCEDLKVAGSFHDVLPSDVSAKHVVRGDEQWFQLLPLSSRQYQYGKGP